jgi:hypothetical protein
LAVPSDFIQLMLIILTISGVAVVGSVVGRLWRRADAERGYSMGSAGSVGRMLDTRRHAMPA